LKYETIINRIDLFQNQHYALPAMLLRFDTLDWTNFFMDDTQTTPSLITKQILNMESCTSIAFVGFEDRPSGLEVGGPLRSGQNS